MIWLLRVNEESEARQLSLPGLKSETLGTQIYAASAVDVGLHILS
jgi:hypothetical protein